MKKMVENMQHFQQYVNLEKFNATSLEDLLESDLKVTDMDVWSYIKTREKKPRNRVKRNSLAGKKGVMYVSLDAGGGGESCPSLADSAAVSLSQMAFLSMSVSIFSVGLSMFEFI